MTITLTIPTPSNQVVLHFRKILELEYPQMHAQRYRVYAKYGYIRREDYPSQFEKDAFDSNSVYYGAFIGERLLGSVRVVRTSPLPIETFFTFQVPQDIKAVPAKERCEIGRLVVERKHPDDTVIPRNIVMLFLIKALVDREASETKTPIAYAYLTSALLRKLTILGIPVHTLKNVQCLYPRVGPMHGYFYSEKGAIVPAYFVVAEIRAYLDSLVTSKRMFDQIGPDSYHLRHSLFNKFLSTLGIL